MVDTIVIFTINDGTLTFITVIATIACVSITAVTRASRRIYDTVSQFLGLPQTFVYLGVFCVVAKRASSSSDHHFCTYPNKM